MFVTNYTHHGGILCILLLEELMGKEVIATGGTDKTIKIWNFENSNFTLKKTLGNNEGAITYLEKFTQECLALLISASSNFEVKIWNPSLN